MKAVYYGDDTFYRNLLIFHRYFDSADVWRTLKEQDDHCKRCRSCRYAMHTELTDWEIDRNPSKYGVKG